jgi:hypothetical protein
MKQILFIAVVVCFFTACSKKIHPSASYPAAKSTTPAKVNKETPVKPSQPLPIPDNSGAATIPPLRLFTEPMIVIDEGGHVITTKDKLPDEIAAKVDYRKITRAFTPDQRQNLIYRFKMVPPRVIFVPDNLSRTSAKGTYCVFKKKFWYWKKEDGLFHLDETYYQ